MSLVLQYPLHLAQLELWVVGGKFILDETFVPQWHGQALSLDSCLAVMEMQAL